jgi:hypothetical protein
MTIVMLPDQFSLAESAPLLQVCVRVGVHVGVLALRLLLLVSQCVCVRVWAHACMCARTCVCIGGHVCKWAWACARLPRAVAVHAAGPAPPARQVVLLLRPARAPRHTHAARPPHAPRQVADRIAAKGALVVLVDLLGPPARLPSSNVATGGHTRAGVQHAHYWPTHRRAARVVCMCGVHVWCCVARLVCVCVCVRVTACACVLSRGRGGRERGCRQATPPITPRCCRCHSCACCALAPPCVRAGGRSSRAASWST